MRIDPEIFKTYDIRGIYPTQLDAKITQLIAQAFVHEFKPKFMVIGYDVREGSKILADAFIKAVLEQGVDVTNIQLCSTPRLYFAVTKHQFDLGIMITASHAKKDYCGIKFLFKSHAPRSEQIQTLKSYTLHAKKSTKLNSIQEKDQGQYQTKDIIPEYIQDLRNFVKTPFKSLKVVVDCGNGVNGPIARKVFENLGLKKVFYLFEGIDPTFPNHGNNPKLAENRAPLAKHIKKTKADLGIIWDGDGDRVYFLDRFGNVISPHFVSALIGQYLIKKDKRKKMTVCVRTSSVVKDLVEQINGEVITLKAWHTEIKYAMEKDPAIIFGTEASGHYIFRDFYRIDDGVLAALVFLEVISAQKESLDEIINQLRQKYHISEEINFSIIGNIKKILKTLARKYKEAQKQSFLDGLSVIYPDWQFNLRPSQTEPFLRLNLSARSEQLKETKMLEIIDFMEEQGGELAEY